MGHLTFTVFLFQIMSSTSSCSVSSCGSSAAQHSDALNVCVLDDLLNLPPESPRSGVEEDPGIRVQENPDSEPGVGNPEGSTTLGASDRRVTPAISSALATAGQSSRQVTPATDLLDSRQDEPAISLSRG